MNNIMIGVFSLYEIITYFFIYAFIGWCCEVIFATLKNGKFTNRGFLNGPVCPIYGFGFIAVLLALSKVEDNIFVLFVVSLILASVLEFITGWILERFFHKKWWDYSNEHFNIKGYVCLRFSILWGIACLFVIKVIHPLISGLVSKMNLTVGTILLEIFMFLILLDLVITILQIVKLNKRYKQIDDIAKLLKRDSNFIGSKLSDLTLSLVNQSKKINKTPVHFSDKTKELLEKIKVSRLVKAFPKLNKEIIKEDSGNLSKNEPHEEVIIKDCKQNDDSKTK